jgi:hypothetical protein
MRFPMRPELSIASVGSSQATAAVDNSVSLAICLEST